MRSLTGRLSAFDPFVVGFPLLVICGAVMVGLLAGLDPKLAVAAALAVVLLLVTMHSLLAGLSGFIVLSFMELVPGLTGPALSLSKVAGAILVVSWLAYTSSGADRRPEFPFAFPAIATVLLVFVTWNVLSVVWAEESAPAIVSTLSFALNFMLFPVAYSAVRKPADVRPLLVAFVAGAGIAAIYGVIAQPDATALVSSPTAAAQLNRLAGSIGDPNELATLLAAGVGVATALVFDSSRNATFRIGSGVMALVLLSGILITLSRGGLLALAAALLAAVLVSPGKFRAMTLGAVATILAVSLVFFFGVASEAARDRITESDGGSGRTDIWQVGWRMVEDHPVRGVGSGNFKVASIHYLLAPGSLKFDQYIVDQPSVAHNAYLQVLAETGVIGLALFLIAAVACIACAARAMRLLRRKGDQPGALLAAGIIAGSVALLAGFFFLSEEHSKHLWLLLALGPAILGASRRSGEPGETGEPGEPAPA